MPRSARTAGSSAGGRASDRIRMAGPADRASRLRTALAVGLFARVSSRAFTPRWNSRWHPLHRPGSTIVRQTAGSGVGGVRRSASGPFSELASFVPRRRQRREGGARSARNARRQRRRADARFAARAPGSFGRAWRCTPRGSRHHRNGAGNRKIGARSPHHRQTSATRLRPLCVQSAFSRAAVSSSLC